MKWYYLGLCAACFFIVQPVQAATLYIDPSTKTVNRGDTFTVAVRLDVDETSGECINAVDGVLRFDDAIEPVDISIGKSIFPVWVEAPNINQREHTITFAGGIPNGYCGRVEGDPNLTNTLIEIILRSPALPKNSEVTSAQVAFDPVSTAYMNDGKGTKALLTTLGTTFTLAPLLSTQTSDPWSGQVADDVEPPEDFSISLERDETTFGGKYYIVFNTTDKQTGLGHYEVIEESQADSKLFRWGAATAPWQEVRSPFVLKDQSLKRVIRVKAVDKAGNEYIATLIPDKSLQTFSYHDALKVVATVMCAALVGLALLFCVSYINRTRRRKIPNEHPS